MKPSDRLTIRWKRAGAPVGAPGLVAAAVGAVVVGWLVLEAYARSLTERRTEAGPGDALVFGLFALVVVMLVEVYTGQAIRLRMRRGLRRMRRRLRVVARPGALRCPFCHGGLDDDDAHEVCDGCAATYHADCRAEGLGGACATLDCARAPRRRGGAHPLKTS